jgi:F420-0:gamma-glutamyl ligase-like protein
VVRGVVRINGAAREAGDGIRLGTKAVLGACAGRVDEVAWGPKPLAVCCAVSEGLPGAIDNFTVEADAWKVYSWLGRSRAG